MSTIVYRDLPDPEDQNLGAILPFEMFGSGLIREGNQTTYEITGRQGVSLVFSGTDFAYNAKGALVSGHATSFQIESNGYVLATVADINVGAAKLKALSTSKEYLNLLGKVDGEGSDGRDVLVAGGKNDNLRGGDGDDVIVGGGGDDTMSGGDGDDYLFFGKGHSAIDGGSGLDIALFLNSILDQNAQAPDMRIDLREAGAQKIAAGISVKLTSIEGAATGSGDDKLTGDALANALSGGAGDDTISGGVGDDTIDGGGGNDVLKGGSGFDTLSFASAGKGVKVSLSQTGVHQTGDGKDKFSGFEDLTGSYLDDKLTGDANSNHIEGGAGDDTIIGGGGIDGLVGGAGADTFLFTKASIGGRGEILDFDIGSDLMDVSKIDANANLDGNQDFFFIGTSAFTGAAGQLRWSYFGNDPTRDILVSGDLNGDKIADFLIQLRSPIGALSGSDFDF